MKKKELFFLVVSLVAVALLISSCSNAPKDVSQLVKMIHPSPANGETISSSNVTLQWKANVPESLFVTYSLYFAINGEPLTLMATGLTKQSYVVKGLELGKAYSWKIVARDNKGHVVNGPLWQFVYREAITYALIGDITTLNPWKPKNANDYFIQNSLNASLYRTIYKTGEVVPYLVKDMWKVLREGNNYTITLHLLKGLKWSDGSDFTSDDVVFTYQTALKNNFWNVKSYSLIKVEKIDEYTVKFYIKDLNLSNILSLFKCPIMEKNFWKSGKYLTFTYETFPSMGPFTVKKWGKNEYVEVTQNPFYPFKGEKITLYKNGAVNISSKTLGINDTYYGTPTGKTVLSFYEGPHVTTITYIFFKTQSQAANNLVERKINFILTSNGLSEANMRIVAKSNDIKVIRNQSEGFRYISFNMRRYPMSNKAFRVAIAYLVDQKTLAKILNNAVLPVYSVVQSENTFWHDPTVKAYGQGMTTIERYEMAMYTLNRGGFTWEKTPTVQNRKLVSKGKGLKGPDGKLIRKIKLLAPSIEYDPLRSAAAFWIEKWANDLGIPIVVDSMGFNKIVKAIWTENYNFDICMLGWGIGSYPDYLKDFFYSKNGIKPGDWNIPGYNDPTFDMVADEFVSQTDMLQARKYAYELQKMLAQDVPYVTLFTSPVIEAYQGIEFPYTQLYGGIEEASGFPSFVKLERK